MTVGSGPIRAGLLAAAGLLAVTAGLTGCSSGKVSQTAEQREAIDGLNLTLGTLDIRDAAVDFPPDAAAGVMSYPAGGNAPLTMVVVNSADTADTLVSASSPVATSVALSPARAGAKAPGIGCVATASVLASASPSSSPKPSGRPSGSASPRGSASASASASPSGSPAAEPAGPPVADFPLPPSSAVQLVAGCQHLVLSGLKKEIAAGQLIPVTLTFKNAGTTNSTFQLPFVSPSTPLPRAPISHFSPHEG